ncbi:hypothetical protein LTR86_006486 [Recurvomyces mirabilis]|nr:hypothetical protein LTR86_006486 [Recurvomyces mirabilis]
MASAAPYLAFLRPLGAPKPSTIRRFLRFSTTTRCRADAQTQVAKQEDPNLIASRSASATYPPNSLKSLPRPKESRASHRSRHPRPERSYPTRHPAHSTQTNSKLIPEPVEPLPAVQCAPNLAYFVSRTPSKELPIYQLRKRGGNLKMTRIKKVDGRPEELRDDLRKLLGLEEKEAVVNNVTKHVMLKGWFKPEVEFFLRQRLF